MALDGFNQTISVPREGGGGIYLQSFSWPLRHPLLRLTELPCPNPSKSRNPPLGIQATFPEANYRVCYNYSQHVSGWTNTMTTLGSSHQRSTVNIGRLQVERCKDGLSTNKETASITQCITLPQNEPSTSHEGNLWMMLREVIVKKYYYVWLQQLNS